jgi:hypothetical protein
MLTNFYTKTTVVHTINITVDGLPLHLMYMMYSH